MKVSALLVAAVMVATSVQASTIESTIQSSRVGFCYAQTTAVACHKYSWCGWNAETKACHNTRELKEEALPVCGDQKSKLSCHLLPWCVWSNDLCHAVIV